MEPVETIKVRIEVNGRIKVFNADYHTLHNNDWNEIVRSSLDDEYFNPGERNTEVTV